MSPSVSRFKKENNVVSKGKFVSPSLQYHSRLLNIIVVDGVGHLLFTDIIYKPISVVYKTSLSNYIGIFAFYWNGHHRKRNCMQKEKL